MTQRLGSLTAVRVLSATRSGRTKAWMASTVASAVVGECDFLNRRSAPRSCSAGGRHRYWPRSIRPCNLHTQQLINEITPDEPDLAATNALREGPGGQFDEMRTSHVEFIGTTGTQKKQLPRTYFECNGDLQGLAAGWADSYHQSTPLQELEITGLPAGTYYLTHKADPDNHWLEGPTATSPGELNNFTWLKFRLDRSSGSNPSITELDHSPCAYPQCGFGGNP